jgi:membrane-bound lytic murein transglycosylase F
LEKSIDPTGSCDVAHKIQMYRASQCASASGGSGIMRAVMEERIPRRRIRRAPGIGRVAVAGACAWLAGCGMPEPGKPLSLLARVQTEGKLRVVTRNAGTSYYLGPHGAVGPEFELAQRFASELGVELEIYAVPSLAELFQELLEGRADIAAAHITVTPARAELMRFGPPYQEISQYVLYKAGAARPRKPDDLAGKRIEVVAGSSYVETLTALAGGLPALRWSEVTDASIDSLLEKIQNGELDLTVADSTAFDLKRSAYPGIKVAFELKSGDRIAWAFRRSDDASLHEAAQGYFARLEERGEIAALLRRYYGHDTRLDHVSTRAFVRHLETRLPSYRDVFEQVAEATGVEWRLLAAMAYQESRWDPRAVSFTGVRGMMMLTEATAAELGVQDRVDVRQSIDGGARYLLAVKEKIPARIGEPDRTFMALAAYNVGYGHLEDARVLTQRHGKNPDLWADVREYLPLLSDERWYPMLKRGYARGREPVTFVRNIRGYYDMLLWMAPPAPEPDIERAGDVQPEPALARATG